MEFNSPRYDTEKQHNQLYGKPSPSSSSGYTFSSDQAINEGLLSGGSVGRSQVEPVDMTEAIYRNLVKERIREEILAEEIYRKRHLEAEVRRELMIEREMAVLSGGGFPSSHTLGSFRSHRYGSEPLQEIYGGSDRHPLEIRVPFQRSPKIQESTRSGKKKVFIGLGEPSGANRKPSQPQPAAAASSKLCPCSSKKKIQEEWSCAICKISATCERAFNEHLAGKKHQANVSTLPVHNRSAAIGLGKSNKSVKTQPSLIKNSSNLKPPPPKPAASCSSSSKKKIPEGWSCTICKISAPCELAFNEHLAGKKHQANVATLQERNKSVKTRPSSKCVSEEDTKNEGENMRQKFKFWCKMCKVGAHDEEVMNNHKKGKKHLKNHQKSKGQDADGTKKGLR